MQSEPEIADARIERGEFEDCAQLGTYTVAIVDVIQQPNQPWCECEVRIASGPETGTMRFTTRARPGLTVGATLHIEVTAFLRQRVIATGAYGPEMSCGHFVPNSEPMQQGNG